MWRIGALCRDALLNYLNAETRSRGGAEGFRVPLRCLTLRAGILLGKDAQYAAIRLPSGSSQEKFVRASGERRRECPGYALRLRGSASLRLGSSAARPGRVAADAAPEHGATNPDRLPLIARHQL